MKQKQSIGADKGGIMTLTATVLDAGLARCRPGWNPRENGSPFSRIYYVKGGSAVYHNASNRHIPLKNGHMYIFPANRAYELTQDDDAPLICIYVHAICLSLDIRNPVETPVLPDTPLCHMIAFLESLLAGWGDRSDISKAVELLLVCVNEHCPISVQRRAEFTPLLRYIADNLPGELTNQAMSKFVGYTCSYFVRWFKTGMGHTPQRYVQLCRMEKAAELLVRELPVEEVAGAIGYGDSKSFSRSFKEAFGVPPSKFKSSHFVQP